MHLPMLSKSCWLLLDKSGKNSKQSGCMQYSQWELFKKDEKEDQLATVKLFIHFIGTFSDGQLARS
jgi:hypothetical protein